MFQQLHALNQEPTDTPPLSSDLQTPDHLNIINVALARQRDAVQAGCAGHPCPDNTNLVNTLYQHHHTLLQHQQQQQRQQQQQQQSEQQQNKQFASAKTAQIGLEQPAELIGQAADALTDVRMSYSPTFQGDVVPDTPIATVTAEAATQEAAVEAAAEVAQDASQGFKQYSGIEGAGVCSNDLLLDLETDLGSRQSKSVVAAAVADTSLSPDSAEAIDQHQVMEPQLPSFDVMDLLMPTTLTAFVGDT